MNKKKVNLQKISVNSFVTEAQLEATKGGKDGWLTTWLTCSWDDCGDQTETRLA